MLSSSSLRYIDSGWYDPSDSLLYPCWLGVSGSRTISTSSFSEDDDDGVVLSLRLEVTSSLVDSSGSLKCNEMLRRKVRFCVITVTVCKVCKSTASMSIRLGTESLPLVVQPLNVKVPE